MPSRKNRGATIRDEYSRCYGAVTSRNNRRGVASGVLCGSAPRIYDSADRFRSESEFSAVEG
jgi:hypothetical protein